MKSYLNAMRPERWPRSLAIYIGTAAFFFLNRHAVVDYQLGGLLIRSGIIFLLTWAISTANYILNEIVDAPYDIHHPTKKHRPLIRGEIKRGPFLLLGVLLAGLSLSTAWQFFSSSFFFSLLSLLIAGFIYNVKPVRTKDIPFLDSISESANNPIRFFIGWFAFAPSYYLPPISLLLSWWAFGNFLMVAKRLSEFRLLKDKAGAYRLSLKKYSRHSLLLGLGASAVVFFLSYISFSISSRLISFVYLSPMVLFYFVYFVRKTLLEEEVMEEPERLFKQPFFAIYTLIMVAAYVIAILLDTPYS